MTLHRAEPSKSSAVSSSSRGNSSSSSGVKPLKSSSARSAVCSSRRVEVEVQSSDLGDQLGPLLICWIIEDSVIMTELNSVLAASLDKLLQKESAVKKENSARLYLRDAAMTRMTYILKNR